MDGPDEEFEDICDEIEEDICIDEDLEEEEEDIAYVSTGGNSGEDDMFDMMVGKLEEIIMEDDFNEQTTQFLVQHCGVFERGEEHKLEYHDIFQQYTALIEQHIEKGLREGVPGFDMAQFLEMLEKREDEVSADVFEMLLSLSDFETFKESILAYKEQRVEGTVENFLSLCGTAPVMHIDEMEDGDERLDLMDGLNIAPLSPGLKGGLDDMDGPPAFGVVAQGVNRSA